MTSPEKKKEWQNMIRILDKEYRNGMLDDYIFHGTATKHEKSIRSEGLKTSEALMAPEGDDAHDMGCFATHWGTPAIASFYAEDTVEYRKGKSPIIIACSIADLKNEGSFEVDANTLICPIDSRLDMTNDEAYDQWSKSEKKWIDCLEIYGSFLVAASIEPDEFDMPLYIPPHKLTILKTVEDVQEFVCHLQKKYDSDQKYSSFSP